MKMRACVAHGAGDLRIEDVERPRPGPGEVAVAIALGGICGSDLHYYHHGGVGDFRIRQPLILGHEVVGRVVEAGPDTDTDTAAVGTPVAVHPGTPCHRCPECAAGRRNICRNTRYLGSAAHFPHVQGGFCDVLVVPAAQLYPVPPGLDLRVAALAEPLSVAVHAVRRAGAVAGRRVLVTGAGPIGSLVVAVLAHDGATDIIVSDLVGEALAVAGAVGGTELVRADSPRLANAATEVDVAIEASGSAAGLAACLAAVRRGGVVVQLGLLAPGDTPIAGNALVTREIDLRGAFRFDGEFAEALALLAGGLPVTAVLSGSYPLDDALVAFEVAGDRHRASKVLLEFGCA